MAVDTRDKRFSMIGLVSVPRVEQKNPSGAGVNLVGRQILLRSYSGIAFGPPGGTVIGSSAQTMILFSGSF